MLTFFTSFLLLQLITKHTSTRRTPTGHQIIKMREELDRGIEILPDWMTIEKPIALYCRYQKSTPIHTHMHACMP